MLTGFNSPNYNVECYILLTLKIYIICIYHVFWTEKIYFVTLPSVSLSAVGSASVSENSDGF